MTTVENYFTNIESYQRIVSTNYDRYLDMVKDYNNFSKGKGFLDVDEETQNLLYAVQKSMDETAMVIIAFSQMTVESFCNAYLIKSYSRKVLSNWSFKKKINKTISLLLLNSGIKFKESDLENYYGEGIAELLKKRNQIVHRYPIIIKFPVGDDIDIRKFKKVSKKAALEIKKQSLHRIDSDVVEKISKSYPSFINKMSDVGCSFENIPFRYKV